LKGKNALITGSTGGIGGAFAKALADQGCNIMLNGFGTPQEIEKLRTAVEAKGVRCAYSPADLAKPAEIAQMMRATEAALGSVDIPDQQCGGALPASGRGISRRGMGSGHGGERFGRVSYDTAGDTGNENTQLGTHHQHGFHTQHARAREPDRLRHRQACRDRITKTVALELAQTGITCNALQPGWVLTQHGERIIADQMAKSGSSREDAIRTLQEARQPSRRFVALEEVAALAVFLCSDAAASITGATISIDGGWSAAS